MWQTLSSKEIYKHPRLTLIEDEVLLPNGQKTTYLKFDIKTQAVTILAKREDGKILIQTEYSYPPNERMFQLPGGVIDDEETKEEAANRELMEETGYRARDLKLLGEYYINNRRSAEKMYVFLGTDPIEEKREADKEEDIEVFWFEDEAIDEMIKKGKVVNSHLLASWSLYKAFK